MKQKSMFSLFILFLCLLGSIAFIFSVPSFHSIPHSASSYEESLEKFALLKKKESTLPLSPQGHSQLFIHGKKTERVFVLLHGLTASPEQFASLASLLFDSGANVIIIRARYAGFANLLNEEQGKQSAQDLLEQASIGLDIASGLGNKISLVGISAAAVSSAWMAQHREGIDQVLLIAPFFGVHGWSTLRTDITSKLLFLLPNFYFSETKASQNNGTVSPYNYPRFGTTSIANTLLLSKNVRSFDDPLKVRRLGILISAADAKVNNNLTTMIAQKWNRENPEIIQIYEFSKDQKVPHDSINPHRSDQKTAEVYPKILEMLQVK